jgi:hypothetical protein
LSSEVETACRETPGLSTAHLDKLDARTGAEVIARFLPITVDFDEKRDGHHLVTVSAA